MRFRTAVSAFTVFAFAFFGTPPVFAADYELYFLGGQSNMEGLGHVGELPVELSTPMEGVMIYHGNPAPDGVAEDGRGLWSRLQPGQGLGFKTDGKINGYCDRFGPELSFAARLRELKPKSRIAIVKYARGGTSIDPASASQFGCWDPNFDGGSGAGRGVNQYDHFLATLRNALAVRDIDGDGEEDRLVPAGIVWMQGESDACHSVESARRYAPKLIQLMDMIRAAMRVDDLPIVIGRISDSGEKSGKLVWPFLEIVQAAQEYYAATDPAAAIVRETEHYGYSDPYHYDSTGYIDLGRRFADAVVELRGARRANAATKEPKPDKPKPVDKKSAPQD